MTSRPMAEFLPGRRRGPSRSHVFSALGGLTFLTLCLFTLHLTALQQLTNMPPSGAATGESQMTSPRDTRPHYEAPSDPQVLRDLIEEAMERELATLPMEYRVNKHPPFKDDPPLLVGDLPREHIPCRAPRSPTKGPGDGESEGRGKRLVFVGDVHGHLAALKLLLQKIDFDNKRGDHLVLAGDMVTKGPDSKGVVKLAMELGASAVRGNQEDKVLAAARELRRLSAADSARLRPTADDAEESAEADTDHDEAEAETRRKGHARRIARSLSRRQLAWIRSLPIILRIGPIPDATSAPWNASAIAVVHGGLVPGVPLEDQDPWAVMNMRSLVYPRKGKGKHRGAHHPRAESDASSDEDGGEGEETHDSVTDTTVAVPIDGRDGEPWSHAWNRYQNHLPASAPHTAVLYGHDAKAGLQVSREVDISPYRSPSKKKNKNKNKNKKKNRHTKLQKETGLRYAFGLDSGCGHGKQLTALVLEAAPEGDVTHRIEQVDCSPDADAVDGTGWWGAELGAAGGDLRVSGPSAGQKRVMS